MVSDGATTCERETVVARGPMRVAAAVDDTAVTLRVERNGRVLPVGIRLGMTVAGVDLGRGSRLLRVARREVVESWTARSGKATGLHQYRHEEAVLLLRHASGLEWQARIRCAEDGVAVRYAIADLHGLSRLDADGTRLTLPRAGRAWVLDYQTWYETPRRGVDLADLAAGDYGFPLLVRFNAEPDTQQIQPDIQQIQDVQYMLVTEAAIDGRFSGAHAAIDPAGVLGFALADATVEIARGDVTPWRVLILGPPGPPGSLAGIVESRLVDNLAPAAPAELAAADWVRPGRAAWSWWSDFFSGAQLDRQKHCVDVAAALGWEHLLIDCGWEETWVPEIVAYASLRGLQVHLWTVWHDLDGPGKLARLARWRSWGVAGIKVDFMESEAKDRYRWYDTVLAESARLGLLVNFHGSVIPRGWARGWPQVVGYEAVRGAEYYVFHPELVSHPAPASHQDPVLTAAHNVIQPFTRNVVGSMDYTPVAFTAPGRTTSDGHELGLAVAFECGITHFADSVDAYLARPLAARFLTELAPSWDETVLLAGTPDTEAVIARRSGDRWFLGAIASGPARTLRVPLDRLGLGAAARVWVVADADPASGTGLRELDRPVEAGETLDVPIAADGGFAAIAAAPATSLFRAAPRPTGVKPAVDPVLAELDVTGCAQLTVSPEARLRVPPGWRAEPLGDGRWRVAADPALPPGALGVVTVEESGDDPRVPRVSHARLVRPLTAGRHLLSALPMVAFRNESGPVERDQSNGGGNPGDGRRMCIAGGEHDDGLGVSTPSTVDVFLGGRADRFEVEVGVDDETPGRRAVARVLGDGAALAVARIEAGHPAVALDVDVTGVRILTLATEHASEPGPASATAPGVPGPGPARASDLPAHVDWAAARISVAADDLHRTPPSGRR